MPNFSRSRRRPAPTPLLPPDFLLRHDLVRRLYLDPLTCQTPPHGWAPLTDAEWEALVPHLAATGCGLHAPGAPGRPLPDPRARLDAIFRAVMLKRPNTEGGGRAPWRLLPPEFGKAPTIARCYRRWTRAGLWARLLTALASAAPGSPLARLDYRLCCAFRRGVRIMGLSAIVLARRLRLHSALPAPSHYLPDPDLSESYAEVFLRIANIAKARPGWWPPKPWRRLLAEMHRVIGGRARIPGAWEPA